MTDLDALKRARDLLGKIQGILVLSNAERNNSSIEDTHDLDDFFKPIRDVLNEAISNHAKKGG